MPRISTWILAVVALVALICGTVIVVSGHPVPEAIWNIAFTAIGAAGGVALPTFNAAAPAVVKENPA